MTYKHVLQRVLGEPAIKKDGNEKMPKGRKENLTERKKRNKSLMKRDE